MVVTSGRRLCTGVQLTVDQFVSFQSTDWKHNFTTVSKTMNSYIRHCLFFTCCCFRALPFFSSFKQLLQEKIDYSHYRKLSGSLAHLNNQNPNMKCFLTLWAFKLGLRWNEHLSFGSQFQSFKIWNLVICFHYLPVKVSQALRRRRVSFYTSLSSTLSSLKEVNSQFSFLSPQQSTYNVGGTERVLWELCMNQCFVDLFNVHA